jgi:hypothetical protein
MNTAEFKGHQKPLNAFNEFCECLEKRKKCAKAKGDYNGK